MDMQTNISDNINTQFYFSQGLTKALYMLADAASRRVLNRDSTGKVSNNVSTNEESHAVTSLLNVRALKENKNLVNIPLNQISAQRDAPTTMVCSRKAVSSSSRKKVGVIACHKKKSLRLAAHSASLPERASPLSPRSRPVSPYRHLGPSHLVSDNGYTDSSLRLIKWHWEYRYMHWMNSLATESQMSVSDGVGIANDTTSNPALFPRAGSLRHPLNHPETRALIDYDWALRNWSIDKVFRTLFLHDLSQRLLSYQLCPVEYSRSLVRPWECDWKLKWKIIEEAMLNEDENIQRDQGHIKNEFSLLDDDVVMKEIYGEDSMDIDLASGRQWTYIFRCGIYLWRALRALCICLEAQPVDPSEIDQHGSPLDRLTDETNNLIVEIFGPYPVGWGGTSDVWKGRLLSSSGRNPIVAVKMLRIFADGTKLGKCLHRETKIWRLLNHDNIASFYGVVFNSSGTPALVSPWYENSSADVYLQKNPSINPMNLIWEIVLGVEYLHQHDIVHGDLKGANVMVDSSGHAKLIDFGFSRIIDTVTGITGGITMTTIAFSTRWCAPELLLSDHAQVTKEADVYAFASTALQLITGEIPYGSQPERSVLMAVLNHIPPELPSTPLRHLLPGQRKFWDLLMSCWKEVSQRPSISIVKETSNCTIDPRVDYDREVI
ncbi:hypothetical protein Clacol_007918 [Clathrus columnatus]|uniref:Protein kinase domain-containing protein n=1 Tax=Clathrus columnatus TaxID=1419009 RepID=A0AAV5AIZ3_9AGAM|nr:hypothetical protein Clacol_007918 [Clathrus columnatus]